MNNFNNKIDKNSINKNFHGYDYNTEFSFLQDISDKNSFFRYNSTYCNKPDTKVRFFFAICEDFPSFFILCQKSFSAFSLFYTMLSVVFCLFSSYLTYFYQKL